jgi:hypothetical protein
METVQTSIPAAARRGCGSVRASLFQLRSSSGFRIATQLAEIPRIDATLEIPVISDSQISGPARNCYLYRLSGLFGKISFELCPRGDGFRGGFLA